MYETPSDTVELNGVKLKYLFFPHLFDSYFSPMVQFLAMELSLCNLSMNSIHHGITWSGVNIIYTNNISAFSTSNEKVGKIELHLIMIKTQINHNISGSLDRGEVVLSQAPSVQDGRAIYSAFEFGTNIQLEKN